MSSALLMLGVLRCRLWYLRKVRERRQLMDPKEEGEWNYVHKERKKRRRRMVMIMMRRKWLKTGVQETVPTEPGELSNFEMH